MNYMPQIISYIGKREDIVEIYMVPKAPPMEKRDNVLVKILDSVLTPEDIRDTLVSLRSNTPHALGPLGKEGSFSFGIHGIGRFRVTYITQRGSYVIHIVKTPHEIPLLSDLCEDPQVVKDMDNLLSSPQTGIILVLGKNIVRTSTFTYSLLQHICSNYSKVIFVLERPLSFLLKHNKSLVIQREVGADVDSFEEGLHDAIQINPDILYVGFRDTMPDGETTKLLRLMELNTLVILQLPYVSLDQLRKDFKIDGEFLKAIIWVEESKRERGKLRIEVKQPPHQEEESH